MPMYLPHLGYMKYFVLHDPLNIQTNSVRVRASADKFLFFP